MASRAAYPLFKAFDANADLLIGGKLYTYDPGTLNDRLTYQDAAATTPHTNPIILDSFGEAEIFIVGDTKFVLKDSDDVQIWSQDSTVDDLGDISDTSDVALGDALVGVKNTSAGAVARTQHDKNEETISAADFGVVADGVTDDTAAWTSFFAAADGKVCLLPDSTSLITSLISPSVITGAKFIGVKGKTVITGSFGYALLQFDELSGVEFHDIEFNNTYTNAAISGNTGVVYGADAPWTNVVFDGCKFTLPNANGMGLVSFARAAAGSTNGSIDGLWIENCEFADIGQSAITLMNRGTAADKYQAAKRVYVRNNTASNLGINGSFGFFISLDGYGSEFEINGNAIADGYLSLIENTGWWHGTINGNQFRESSGHPRKWRAIAMDGASFGGIQSVTVADNKVIGNATVDSQAIACTYCDFHGNVWTFTENGFGVDQAFAVYDCNYCTFADEVYISDDKYAIRLLTLGGTCQNNRFKNCTADTSASAANTAVVNFDGASVSDNVWDGYMIKGTGGGVWTETTSAADNLVGYDEVGDVTMALTCATPGDLVATATGAGRYTRKGRLCTVEFELITSTFTHTTASGIVRLTGLPFPALGARTDFGVLGGFAGITKANYTQFNLRTNAGQSYLGIYAGGSAQAIANLAITDMPTGGSVLLLGSITYIVDDG